MKRIVVAGAGLAGHRAAVALRREGFDGELTLIGDESHRPYDRPPLSKRVLAGAMEPDDCAFPCDDLDATWELGKPAASLDLERRVVRLDGGGEIGFDGLVIATGRRARELPGLPPLAGLRMLRSLDDSLALRGEVRPDLRVVVVGAGFIGCEVAATLRGAGVEEVTLVDVAPLPLAPLGPEVGRRAADLHASHGVKLRLGSGVAEFEGSDRLEAVRLADGEHIPADLALVAVGSAPNSEWLADSGLDLFHGTVRCDEHCFAVGADDIVAAGDIASWPHPHAGDDPVWVEHWTNARDMAAAAAANLLAEPADRTPFVPVPTFWSDQYDVKMKSAGFLGRADSYSVVHDDPERPALVVEAHRGDELVGAVVFNRNRTIIDYQRRLAEMAVA